MNLSTSSRYSTVLGGMTLVWLFSALPHADAQLSDESYEILTPQGDSKSTKKKVKKKSSGTDEKSSTSSSGSSRGSEETSTESTSSGSKKSPLQMELKRRYVRNPVFELNAIARSAPSDALEILIGADSNPSVSSFGGKIRLFIPEPEQAVEWLNWIGIYYGRSSAQTTRVAFLRSGDSAPIHASINGSTERAGLAVRVPFLDSVVSAIQMEIDVLNQFEESLSDIPASSGFVSNLSYRSIGPTLSLGIELSPAKNVFLGADVYAPITQSLTAADRRSNGTTVSTKGSWQRMLVHGFAGFRYFASRNLYFAGSGQISYRSDLIRASELTGSSEKGLDATYFSAIFGVGFVLVHHAAVN